MVHEHGQEEDRLHQVERRSRAPVAAVAVAGAPRVLGCLGHLHEQEGEEGRCHEQGGEVLHAPCHLPVDDASGQGHDHLDVARVIGRRDVDAVLVGRRIGGPEAADGGGVGVLDDAAVDDDAGRGDVGVEAAILAEHGAQAVDLIERELVVGDVVEPLTQRVGQRAALGLGAVGEHRDHGQHDGCRDHQERRRKGDRRAPLLPGLGRPPGGENDDGEEGAGDAGQ
jgi:hypothetical protein